MTIPRPLLWTIVLVLLPVPYGPIEASEAVQSQRALMYLSPEPYREILIEIDAVEGFEPDDEAIDALVDFLKEHCRKPVTVTKKKPIPRTATNYPSAHVLGTQNIQGPTSDDSRGTPAYIYMLFHHGAGGSKAMAYALGGYCAITVDMSGLKPWERWSLGWTLKHEAGHLLGLCKNKDHGDGVHCRNKNCIMQPRQVARLSKLLSGKNPISHDLCDECKSDLRQIKDSGADCRIEFRGPFMIRREKEYFVATLPSHRHLGLGPDDLNWDRMLKLARDLSIEQLAGLPAGYKTTTFSYNVSEPEEAMKTHSGLRAALKDQDKRVVELAQEVKDELEALSPAADAPPDNKPQEKASQGKAIPSPQALKLDYQALLSKGEYVEAFENQLSLILAEYWSEDGNWKADMMNDASAFAPRLLFKMYAKTNQEELYRRAIITCNYEKQMLGNVILGKQTLDLHSIFGVYGLLSSMKHAKTEQERAISRQLMELVLAIGGRGLLFDTEQSLFPDLQDYKCISLPFVAFACLEFYEIEPQDAVLDMARQLIQKHEEQFYNKETGLFWGTKFGDWNSALGLLALSKAYSVTKEEQYLHKAQELVKNLKKRSAVFGGVFFGEPSLDINDNWVLHFSTMLIHIDAFWELYQSTGDEQYKNCVKRAIDFAVKEFILSQAYPAGFNDQWFNHQKKVVPFFSHDIRVVNGEKVVAPSYCMGCILFMLNHIWDYNEDVAPSRRASDGVKKQSSNTTTR